MSEIHSFPRRRVNPVKTIRTAGRNTVDGHVPPTLLCSSAYYLHYGYTLTRGAVTARVPENNDRTGVRVQTQLPKQLYAANNLSIVFTKQSERLSRPCKLFERLELERKKKRRPSVGIILP